MSEKTVKFYSSNPNRNGFFMTEERFVQTTENDSFYYGSMDKETMIEEDITSFTDSHSGEEVLVDDISPETEVFYLNEKFSMTEFSHEELHEEALESENYQCYSFEEFFEKLGADIDAMGSGILKYSSFCRTSLSRQFTFESLGAHLERFNCETLEELREVYSFFNEDLETLLEEWWNLND